MDNKNILIRLLKEGHISEVEFESLYEGIRQVEVIDVTLKTDAKDFDWMPTLDEQLQNAPLIWHGTIHPATGEPLGATYSVTN